MGIKIRDKAYKILPGDLVLFKDEKKVGVCFEEGELEVLSFDKSIDKETVERFIDLFMDFYESRTRKTFAKVGSHV